MPLEFIWFTPPDLLLLFGGTTSSNDVFQLCFEIKCMIWILQHLMTLTNKLFYLENWHLHLGFASRFIFCSFQKIPLSFAEVCSVLTVE